ncbi:hypothetical protein B0H10DRAFT_1963107 [Mycena sp. CBHHK59/15]|nr:hypothetical protein B0H10DRAFT_1963107 [Mycena sp. CBHHK59/15]
MRIRRPHEATDGTQQTSESTGFGRFQARVPSTIFASSTSSLALRFFGWMAGTVTRSGIEEGGDETATGDGGVKGHGVTVKGAVTVIGGVVVPPELNEPKWPNLTGFGSQSIAPAPLDAEKYEEVVGVKYVSGIDDGMAGNGSDAVVNLKCWG